SPPVAPIAGALAERLGDDPNALRTGVSAAREAKAGAAGLRPLAGSLRLLARRPKPPAGSVADRGLGAEALDRLADPQERLLELPGALEVGVPELGPELVHAEAEQELLGGLLVDPLRLGAGVELGEEAQRLALDGRAVDQVRAHRAARLVGEVVRRQLGEDRDEARVRDDAGERGPLAADRGGHAPRREGGLGRADARELRRHPEAVARPADRLALLRRVGQGRERDDVHLEAPRDRQLHAAQRRRLAGLVAVEGEEEPLGQPAELAELRLRERRPHAGDDGPEAGLPQREHVRVALDDAGPLLLQDRVAGAVEPVDDVALAEELRLGRVDVLPRSGSSSWSRRAWNPSTRPRASASGKSSRRWK